MLRLPIDEWIVAIALALRCLPLLIDEMRTLAAARRLRYRNPDQQKQLRGAVIEIHDLVSTAIIVSLRRAHDLADAITARGGIGAISDGHDGDFGWQDAVDARGGDRDRRARCSSWRCADARGRQTALATMSSSTSATWVINPR